MFSNQYEIWRYENSLKKQNKVLAYFRITFHRAKEKNMIYDDGLSILGMMPSYKSYKNKCYETTELEKQINTNNILLP